MICNRCWVLHLQRLLGPGSDFCSLLNLFVLSHLGGGESKKLISSYSCVLQTKEGLGTVDYGFCCLEACNLQGTSTIPVGFILFLVTISILNHGILIWSIPSAQNPSSPPHPPSPSRFCKAFLRPENKNYKNPWPLTFNPWPTTPLCDPSWATRSSELWARVESAHQPLDWVKLSSACRLATLTYMDLTS